MSYVPAVVNCRGRDDELRRRLARYRGGSGAELARWLRSEARAGDRHRGRCCPPCHDWV